MDASDYLRAKPIFDRHRRQEEAWTRELRAATQDVACEECRWEIVRTGGVVGNCDEHR